MPVDSMGGGTAGCGDTGDEDRQWAGQGYPMSWTVTVCPAGPLCLLVLPAPRLTSCAKAPQGPLPAGFLWGSAPGRPNWTRGD